MWDEVPLVERRGAQLGKCGIRCPLGWGGIVGVK